MKRGLWIVIVLALVLTVFGTGPRAFAQNQPAKPNVDKNQQLLQTVGVFATANLYHTYLNIGFIADGKAEGLYDEKDMVQILGTSIALLDILDKQFEMIGKLDLTKEDLVSLDNLRKLAGLLRQQSDELQAFWKTGDKERGAKYEKIRKEAWTGISKLMGLAP